MEVNRKPYQGVLNIIRFNWHFYLIATIILFALLLSSNLFPASFQALVYIGTGLMTISIFISLIVSYYAYDLSDLYKLKWLNNFFKTDNIKILTVNAGFDETSEIIESQISNSELVICDFYDPEKHTEISIKRARKAYPPNPKTIAIKTDQLPFSENTFDKTLAILSAHEIRDEKERVQFFQELNRITKASGQILVTEHLRDFNNFLAYTIGFFHFYSRASWLQTFERANLTIKQELKTTPFITTFILEKDGDTF